LQASVNDEKLIKPADEAMTEHVSPLEDTLWRLHYGDIEGVWDTRLKMLVEANHSRRLFHHCHLCFGMGIGAFDEQSIIAYSIDVQNRKSQS
jgi:hypothetical protein